MLIIKYNPNNTKSILLNDGYIEKFLLNSINTLNFLNISQISIIYVLRKLVAQKKIKASDIIIRIKKVDYTLNNTGRFNSYPEDSDLFDDCLDAILKMDKK